MVKTKRMELNKYIPGDLAMINGDIVKIMAVCFNYNLNIIQNYDVMFPNGNIYKYEAESLKEIPLTPDILKKNGWEFRRGFYWSPNEEGAGVGLISQTGYVWEAYIGRHLLRSNINSVSDLQHLLFGIGLNSEMEV